MKFYNVDEIYIKEALVLAIEEYSIECSKCPQLIVMKFIHDKKHMVFKIKY